MEHSQAHQGSADPAFEAALKVFAIVCLLWLPAIELSEPYTQRSEHYSPDLNQLFAVSGKWDSIQ